MNKNWFAFPICTSYLHHILIAIYVFRGFFQVRTSPVKAVCFRFALDYQHALGFVALLYSEVFDLGVIFVAQIIEAQTILAFIY